jgi:hypothetical protein
MQEEIINTLTEVFQSFPKSIHGTDAILEMKNTNYSNWRQTEWQGWYIQYLFEKHLDKSKVLIPGKKCFNTVFDADFNGNQIDIKTHTIGSNDLILNDKRAINQIIIDKKIYIACVSGYSKIDSDNSFKEWFNSLKGGLSKYQIKNQVENKKSKQLKIHFTLDSLSIYSIDNTNVSSLSSFQDGMKNSNDIIRNSKFKLNVKKFPSLHKVEKV